MSYRKQEKKFDDIDWSTISFPDQETDFQKFYDYQKGKFVHEFHRLYRKYFPSRDEGEKEEEKANLQKESQAKPEYAIIAKNKAEHDYLFEPPVSTVTYLYEWVNDLTVAKYEENFELKVEVLFD